LAVHAGLAAIAAGQPAGVGEDVLAIDLVGRGIEAEIGRFLRFRMKGLLKLLYLDRSL
jgi:hypothetical protein